MMKVCNLVSARSGRCVPNQFEIMRTNEEGVVIERTFQSYESECARLERVEGGLYKLTITRYGFYSRTTAKYLRAWLMETVNPERVPDILREARTAISNGAETWEEV